MTRYEPYEVETGNWAIIKFAPNCHAQQIASGLTRDEAKMFAAAHVMLAACKETVEYYMMMSGNVNAPVADKYWIKGAIMAREAIAKIKK